MLPPLTTLATAVLGAIAKILPVVLPLLTTLAGVFTGAVVAAISGVATALADIINAIPPSVLQGIVLAILAIVGGIKAWSIAQGILDIALDANPIGAITLAIAALVVGITELVDHWSTVWVTIKSVAGRLEFRLQRDRQVPAGAARPGRADRPRRDRASQALEHGVGRCQDGRVRCGQLRHSPLETLVAAILGPLGLISIPGNPLVRSGARV